MSDVVVGYPDISKSDYDWIQNIRKVHDKQFSLLQPHFTFVFPTDKLPIDELASHVEVRVSGTPVVEFKLTKAVVIEDASKASSYIFLVPSEGSDEINKLHDELYKDKLASELRLDLPFMPHVTIGTGSHESMEDLAKSLNEQGINIAGVISALSVASYDGQHVTEFRRLELASQ